MGNRRKDDLGPRLDQKIQIVVSSSLHRKLKAISETTSKTMSDVCRNLLTAAVTAAAAAQTESKDKVQARFHQEMKQMLDLRRLDAS